jgi:hypothetical protein
MSEANGRIQVEIIGNYEHAAFKIGEQGFVDGYVRGADDRPYAVVIIGEKIDMVPLYSLNVINK